MAPGKKDLQEDCFLRLKEGARWQRWTFDSRPLYESRCAAIGEERSYEHCFAYLQQECRHNAAMHVSDEILATVYSRSERSNFAIFLPSICNDRTAISAMPGLCREVKEATGRRVVLRKCQPAIFEALKARSDFRVMHPEEYKNPRELPEDILPQVVVDVAAASALEGHNFMKIRNHIRYAQKRFRIEGTDLTRDNRGALTEVILVWAREYNERAKARQTKALEIVDENGVDPDSYTVFSENFADLVDNRTYFARVILMEEHPVAFSFAGRTASGSAGLYASLCMDRTRGISEIMLADMMHCLGRNDVRLLNLGGSETPALFEYKRKWGVESLRQTFELEYIGSD